MERFRGNLANYKLQLLVPAFIASPQAGGTLRVERAAVRRLFFLQEGLLVGESSSEPHEHLGQVLVDLHILDAAQAAEAFAEAEAAGVPFGTYVVERGLVERPRLVEALEHKAREALFDCYGWESGEVEFIPGLPPMARAVELRLSLRTLHRDAEARSREWRVFWSLFHSGPDTTFQVFREYAVELVSQEEERLFQLAEQGARLAELLQSCREGQVHGARWVLRLYRRGALTPQEPEGPRVGKAAELEDLLALAQRFLKAGRYESAVAVAAQVLERAPVPEAHALYREAELQLAREIANELLKLDGRLIFEPLPRPPPPLLTADDLYLYSRLRAARSVDEALRGTAMGELAAWRSLQRLLRAEVVRVAQPHAAARPRRKTDPYGIPVVQ